MWPLQIVAVCERSRRRGAVLPDFDDGDTVRQLSAGLSERSAEIPRIDDVQFNLIFANADTGFDCDSGGGRNLMGLPLRLFQVPQRNLGLARPDDPDQGAVSHVRGQGSLRVFGEQRRDAKFRFVVDPEAAVGFRLA